MGKRDKRRSESFRAKVRELLSAGYATAQIAKHTGQPYDYTAMIVAQERSYPFMCVEMTADQVRKMYDEETTGGDSRHRGEV